MAEFKRRIDVMVSSTTNDLGEHRRKIGEVISSERMVPRIMDLDSSTGKDGLTYSLDLVDEAEVYILLLGFRYGYIPEDPERNPDGLSMTHLEYRRAKERKAKDGLCVFAYLMDDEHAVKPAHVDTENANKLRAFRKEVQGDQVAFFTSIEDLAGKVRQSLNTGCVRALQAETFATRQASFRPREGEMLDERYIFEHELGQGGNGEVWKARERLPDGGFMDVAIKLLKPEISEDERRVERFKREIALMRRLRHPHIILTTNYGEVGKREVGGQFYAVMDYIAGQTLRDFMQGRRFSIEDTVHYLGQIAEALNTAHKQGVTHRDVKPENILIKDDKLHLGDFGLAISPEEDMSLSKQGEWVGTKKYMAPEQWDAQPVTPQTDLYALAIIAYEMLTGMYPYDASSHPRLMQAHMNQTLPPHPELPQEVLSILHRATLKTPTSRYDSAPEFIAELQNWRADAANLDTIIRKYLHQLRVSVKGDVYEKLFVDLEGDMRQIIAQIQQETHELPIYDDPMLEFDSMLDGLLVDLDADHYQERAQTEAEKRYVPSIIDQLLTCERVVLVGEPGAGKTFTLRRLVMRYIREYDEHQRVPVFVPLNAFKGEVPFTEYIKHQMGKTFAPYYEQLLADERLVLICDALNEMPRTAITDERDLVAEVRQTLSKATHFVVSCRIRDYRHDLDSLKLERLEVRDLELPAIREFVRRYRIPFKYDDGELWRKMGGSDDIFTFWNEVNAKEEGARFWDEEAGIPSYTSTSGDSAWREMWRGAKLIPLSRNPYLAQMICSLHGQAQMPDNRAQLYQAFVDKLYQREAQQAQRRGQTFPEQETLNAFLTSLADAMQAQATTVLKSAPISDKALLQASLDASILTQIGDDVRFSHQLLQEYFAARTLLNQMMNDAPAQAVLGETWWNVTVWRETANMLIDFSKDVLRVMRWIAPASLPLVEEIASTHELSITELGEDFLLAIAGEQKEAENPIGRAFAYRVLGLLNGDTRPGVGTFIRDGVKLPDIEWVTIPRGEFGYQDGTKTLDYDYQIARYPVTYAQFQTFLDDPEGYAQKERWFEGLHEDSLKRDLSEQSFKYWNHPREKVSWYDAIAFCRWYSWRLGGKYALDAVEQWAVRLPTEFEWEKAARALTGWTYPYGNEFDAMKGNTHATGIGQTSAVGIFPSGDTPHWEKPISDLSGNVWEWCLTDYKNPQMKAADENVRSNSRRVLRAGSWVINLSLARAVYRYFNDPDGRDSNIGFRLFCRPPSR